MEDANNFDPARSRKVEDHIATEGKASKIWRQFWPEAPQFRISRQQPKFLIKSIDEPIGGGGAVLGYVGPEFCQVRGGLGTNDY
jgi:hypothetical protein